MVQDQRLRKLLQTASTIAIVGAKDKAGSPVDRVGRYLMQAGCTVWPVHPARPTVWGLPAFKSLDQLACVPDIVCLFRAPEYCPVHAREVLELSSRLGSSPLAFWMQLGISSPEAHHMLEASGMLVVEDKCLMVEHKRLCADPDPDELFLCRRCGHCCRGEGGIVVSPGDLSRLSRYFRIPEQKFLHAYTRQRGGKAALINGSDGYCVFFRQENGCDIHEARPDVCRAWPYFRGNLVDEVSFHMARKDCPGISPGSSHSDFAWAGYRYLCQHALVANDKSCEGHALIIREDELPSPGRSRPLPIGKEGVS